jgi:hypothetical protein
MSRFANFAKADSDDEADGYNKVVQKQAAPKAEAPKVQKSTLF